MCSEMAIEDIRSLEEQGIKLDVGEIVRLNALGVRCELHPNASSFYALPRCAFLGNGENQVVFREPTIGHQIWLDNVVRIYDENDETTIFLLKAYAMSKSYADELPKWNNIAEIQSELKKFIMDVVGRYTSKQIMSCVNYCLMGNNANEHEYPPIEEDELKEDEKEIINDVDNPYSTAIGVMHDAQAIKLGISINDMKQMTTSELQAVIQRAYEDNGVDVSKSMKQRAIGDYYRTLEEIKRQHEVKQNG